VSFIVCLFPTLMNFFIIFYPNLCFIVVSCGKKKRTNRSNHKSFKKKRKIQQKRKNFKQALALAPCTHSQGARLIEIHHPRLIKVLGPCLTWSSSAPLDNIAPQWFVSLHSWKIPKILFTLAHDIAFGHLYGSQYLISFAKISAIVIFPLKFNGGADRTLSNYPGSIHYLQSRSACHVQWISVLVSLIYYLS
jgi:hypothetical protein